MDDRETVLMEFRKSPFRMAAEAAGFTFKEPVVEPWIEGRSMVTMEFTCVCGMVEKLTFTPCLGSYDPCQVLHFYGSFSYEHLLNDLYTPEDARRISDTYSAELQRLLEAT